MFLFLFFFGGYESINFGFWSLFLMNVFLFWGMGLQSERFEGLGLGLICGEKDP